MLIMLRRTHTLNCVLSFNLFFLMTQSLWWLSFRILIWLCGLKLEATRSLKLQIAFSQRSAPQWTQLVCIICMLLHLLDGKKIHNMASIIRATRLLFSMKNINTFHTRFYLTIFFLHNNSVNAEKYEDLF